MSAILSGPLSVSVSRDPRGVLVAVDWRLVSAAEVNPDYGVRLWKQAVGRLERTDRGHVRQLVGELAAVLARSTIAELPTDVLDMVVKAALRSD